MIRLKETEPDEVTSELSEKDMENLQERLFILQNKAFEAKIANIFLIEGWSSSGRGEILQVLTERLDPKKFKVHSPFVHQSEDKNFPFLRSFWQVLPRFGESLFYLNSYLGRLAFLKNEDKIEKEDYEDTILSVLNTERMLSKDRLYFHKFFLHISEKEQSKRLGKSKKNKRTWELSSYDKDQSKHYSKYRKTFESLMNSSHSDICPWIVISADDSEKAKAQLLTTLVERLEKILNINSAEELKLLLGGKV
ncbi:polyphosphate kinase [Leptospira idonii]|uniref:Polyphosphate kinase n=1 Tax=Leptospira idonii TaxID=1193500 RepID=A0A4R9M3C8_9LEPT|nr:polyphosphate kinase [Leptospira idonii]TGN19308.1 polyphosphate kinase [Leptospira idonii]